MDIDKIKERLQEDIVKAWAKMELNSSYGFPPVPVIPMEYDENKALQITEEGKKNLMVIQEATLSIRTENNTA
jgi:hypothetical protein